MSQKCILMWKSQKEDIVPVHEHRVIATLVLCFCFQRLSKQQSAGINTVLDAAMMANVHLTLRPHITSFFGGKKRKACNSLSRNAEAMTSFFLHTYNNLQHPLTTSLFSNAAFGGLQNLALSSTFQETKQNKKTKRKLVCPVPTISSKHSCKNPSSLAVIHTEVI